MEPLKEIFAPRRIITNSDYLGKPVSAADYTRVIKESAIIELEGNLPVVYLKIEPSEFDYLRELLLPVFFPKSTRKNLGINNYSLLVGAISAVQNRHRFCTYAPLQDYSPILSAFICDVLSTLINDIFDIVLPEMNEFGQTAFYNSGIHSDYQLKNTSWTSAVLNKNSAQYYHFDSSNLSDCYSAMATLKNKVNGGYLVLPEYDIAVEVADSSLIFFYGKGVMHGVSNIQYLQKDSYRYSLVYYAVRGLIKCGSIHNEYLKA